MVRFACDIMERMITLTRELEVELGPDTGDLKLRAGIHSGAVTAGILRGQKARFQYVEIDFFCVEGDFGRCHRSHHIFVIYRLFGDAMNTASRVSARIRAILALAHFIADRFIDAILSFLYPQIESNGLPGKIQVSQSTADLLFSSGCGHWLTKREDKVSSIIYRTVLSEIHPFMEKFIRIHAQNLAPAHNVQISAKGKGLLQTYWVTTPIAAATPDRDELSSASGYNVFANLSDDEASVSSQRQALARDMSAIGVHNEEEAKESSREARRKRLVAWNVETLLRHIKLIVSHRASRSSQPEEEDPAQDFTLTDSGRRRLPMEEVKEIITLPEYEGPSLETINPASVQIPEIIVQQLESLVTAIGLRYNDCEFHNFDHASHVTNSVSKLLSRIVGPKEDDASQDAKAAHDSSFGITSDPLTQFACVLSALVHDLDHFGVPNTQLVKEKADLAEQYGYRSVAEQHSLDLAWDLFMCEKYDELRSIVCPTSSELRRLREIVVNAVLATDIGKDKTSMALVKANEGRIRSLS
jgi:3'5'-cyclic nucleotide phosphodiesterase